MESETMIELAITVIVIFLSFLYFHYRYKAKLKALEGGSVRIHSSESSASSSESTLNQDDDVVSRFQSSSSQIADLIKSVMQLDEPQWTTLQSLMATSWFHRQLLEYQNLTTHLEEKVQCAQQEFFQQLEATRSILYRAAEDHANQKSTIEDLKDQLERRSIYVADLANELLGTRGGTSSGLIEASTPSGSLAEENMKIMFLNKAMATLQAENNDLKSEIIKLTNFRMSENSQQTQNTNSEAQIGSVAFEEKERLADELIKLRKDYSRLEEEKNKLTVNYQETCRVLDQNLVALKETRDELTNNQAERDTIVATLGTTQSTVNDISHAYEEALKELNSTKVKYEALVCDGNSLAEMLQSSNASMKKELEILQKTMPTFKSDLEDYIKLQASHDNLEENVAIWRQKYDSENLLASNMKERHDHLKSEYEALKREHNTMAEELHRARTEYNKIQLEHGTISKDLEKTQGFLFEQIKLTDAAHTLLHDMEASKMSDLHDNMESSSQKIAELEILSTRQKEEAIQLQKQLDQSNNEFNTIKLQVNHLQQAVIEKVDEINQAKYNNEILRSEMVSIKKERDAAELNYQNTVAEETEIRKKAQYEIAELMAKNFELRHRITELEASDRAKPVAHTSDEIEYNSDNTLKEGSDHATVRSDEDVSDFPGGNSALLDQGSQVSMDAEGDGDVALERNDTSILSEDIKLTESSFVAATDSVAARDHAEELSEPEKAE